MKKDKKQRKDQASGQKMATCLIYFATKKAIIGFASMDKIENK